MNQKEFKQIEQFAAGLPGLRRSTNDQVLLDQCQANLRALVGLVKDKGVGLDPAPPEDEQAQSQ